MRNGCTNNRIISTFGVAMGLGMFPLFSGCMTLEQMAPPVEGEFQMIAARHSVDTTTLEWGREIYLSDCVKCHSVEPIGRYSAKRWRKILSRMAEESKLDDQRLAAVAAYVTLARVLLEEKPKSEREIATSRERASRETALGTYAAGGSR